jgi:hypothetical protein
MKGRTIIGLVLAVGLLLISTVAYAHWNDHGNQGNYGTGYAYGCGYGHAYGAGYNANVNYNLRGACTPGAGYRHGKGKGYAYDNLHGQESRWTGRRGHGRMGPKGSW